MHTIAWLNAGEKRIAAAERSRARGMEVTALSQFSQRQSQSEGLVLGLPAALRLSYAGESMFWRRCWALSAQDFVSQQANLTQTP